MWEDGSYIYLNKNITIKNGQFTVGGFDDIFYSKKSVESFIDNMRVLNAHLYFYNKLFSYARQSRTVKGALWAM
jgi:hypothetical protein